MCLKDGLVSRASFSNLIDEAAAMPRAYGYAPTDADMWKNQEEKDASRQKMFDSMDLVSYHLSVFTSSVVGPVRYTWCNFSLCVFLHINLRAAHTNCELQHQQRPSLITLSNIAWPQRPLCLVLYQVGGILLGCPALIRSQLIPAVFSPRKPPESSPSTSG